MVSGVCVLSLYVVGYVFLSLSLREFGCGAGGWRTYDRQAAGWCWIQGAAIGVLDGMFRLCPYLAVFCSPVWSVSVCSGRHCNYL